MQPSGRIACVAKPVSSRSSRRAHSIGFSPGSTRPAGSSHAKVLKRRTELSHNRNFAGGGQRHDSDVIGLLYRVIDFDSRRHAKIPRRGQRRSSTARWPCCAARGFRGHFIPARRLLRVGRLSGLRWRAADAETSWHRRSHTSADMRGAISARGSGSGRAGAQTSSTGTSPIGQFSRCAFTRSSML